MFSLGLKSPFGMHWGWAWLLIHWGLVDPVLDSSAFLWSWEPWRERGESWGKRQWRKERDRETKPERETMTLEVTHSYHEYPHSERKNNEGFSLPSTAWGQPFGHITLSNPIFCVLHVIICKVLVPWENTESKQCPGLVFICTLKLHCVGKLIGKEKAARTSWEQDHRHVDIQTSSLDSANLNFQLSDL